MIAPLGQASLRPMHAIGSHARREFGIGGDQQEQAASMANLCELPRARQAISGAEMAVHHRRATRQTPRRSPRIGRAFGVGEEIKIGHGRAARSCVETARQAR